MAAVRWRRGARWSRDGTQAWRLWDGQVVEAIDLDYAREIADMLGLPVPVPEEDAPATPSPALKKGSSSARSAGQVKKVYLAAP